MKTLVRGSHDPITPKALDYMNPKISVLAVGGTIAMTGDGGAGVLPKLDAQALVAAVPELESVARIQAYTLFTVPSCHLDLSMVLEIAQAVEREVAAGAAGVVVTQGTDTIDESAFLLDMLLHVDVPVVVTGAMRNPALPGADGPANMLAAARVATAEAARGRGVMVVMDGHIHAARFVRKTHTSSVSAFRSDPVLLGHVTDGSVTFFCVLPVLPQIGFAQHHTPSSVALLAAAMGDDARLIDHVLGEGYAGLVIAGMGGGHVPPAMIDRLERVAEHMPVAVGTRVEGGSTLSRTYAFVGGEMDLARRGMILSGWLSPLKARLALSLLIGAGANRDDIRAFFSAFEGG